MRFLIGDGQSELALRMAGALTWWWRMRCRFREGREAIRSALLVPSRSQVASRAAAALWGLSWMELMLQAEPLGRGPLDTALTIYRRLQNRSGQARTLLLMGNRAHLTEVDGASALDLLRRSADLAPEAGDAWCLGHALGMTARVRLSRGDVVGAR